MNFKKLGSALFIFSMGAVALIGCNKPVTSKVTITFDGNGGTVIPANDETSTTLEVNKGTVWKDITNKPSAKKEHYTFDNVWTFTKDDKSKSVGNDFAFNENVTLYAFYDEIKFTYKFTDGDKVIKEEKVKEGTVIVAPEDLDDKHAKDTDNKYYHFTFDNWYDGETPFVEGTKISKDVTYNAKFTKGDEVELVPGKKPTCSDSGFKDAYKCEECFASADVVAYYDVPDSIADEHLIGDEDAYNEWKAEGGEGYLEPTGQHDYQPEFRGTYTKTYTALQEFNKSGLEVYLHCSYETEHDNDIEITDYQVEYEAEDDKLHVNEGAYVTFTYGGKDYKEDLPLTINPIKVTEPAKDTASYAYTGTEITYQVAASNDYTVTGNKQTNAGEYTVTIALKDKSGDHVWTTSEDTDDLEYEFIIAKGTNAIAGLETSYTTTCHTAPTITGVTSTWGEVQFDYWKKVGQGEETQVTVDQLEAAENTTYRVRAFVPGTGNYDLVEQYATLVVNHDWDDEYVPTDVIGYKAHECKICEKVEHTTNLMADADCIFEAKTESGSAKTTWGGTYSVIYSDTSQVDWVDTNLKVNHTLVYVQGDWQSSVEKEKMINLPKINYSLYDKVTFVCAQGTGTPVPIQFKVGDAEVLPSQNRQNYNFEVTYVPAAEGLGKIKVVGYDLTNNVQTTGDIFIEDSKIVTGEQSLVLTSVDARGETESHYGRAGIFKILLNHTCDPQSAIEVLPTDVIGAYDLKCPDCGRIFAKSTTKFMSTTDVDLVHNFYGANMAYSAGQTHPEEAKCEVTHISDAREGYERRNGIEYKADYVSSGSTEISYTQRYDIGLPKVQYSAYEKVEFDLVSDYTGYTNFTFQGVTCTVNASVCGVHITVTMDADGSYILTASGYGTSSDTFEGKSYALTEDEVNGIDSVDCISINTLINSGKALPRSTILNEIKLTPLS